MKSSWVLRARGFGSKARRKKQVFSVDLGGDLRNGKRRGIELGEDEGEKAGGRR